MSDNQMLQLILDEIKSLKQGQDSLQQSYVSLQKGQDKMMEEISDIKHRVTNLETDVAHIKKEVDDLGVLARAINNTANAAHKMANNHEKYLTSYKSAV